MSVESFVEVVGWFGTAAILGSYIATQFKLLEQHTRTYQVLNFFGSIGFIINSGYHGAYPNAFLNVIWALVALIALVTILRTRS